MNLYGIEIELKGVKAPKTEAPLRGVVALFISRVDAQLTLASQYRSAVNAKVVPLTLDQIKPGGLSLAGLVDTSDASGVRVFG